MIARAPDPDKAAALAASQPSSLARRIWLCADDYGISPAVSAAIRDLILRGRLNATSVMVAAPHFDRSEALPLAMLNIAHKRVAIGLHVTLTAPFRPLSPNFKPTRNGTFLSIGQLTARALSRRLDTAALVAEVSAQFNAFMTAFGQPPDFVDGHQHVQLLPGIDDAVLEGIRACAPQAWVRQCGLAVRPWQRLSDPKGLFLHGLSRRFRARAAARGVRTNAAFAGTYDFATQRPFAELFPAFLENLPDGGVIMCHPGKVDAELLRLDPLTHRREEEYSYLASEAFAHLLRTERIGLA